MFTNTVLIILIMATAGVTFIIHRYSCISAGVIDFDGQSKKETFLMYKYNHFMDSMLMVYMAIVIIFASVYLLTGNAVVVCIALKLQLLYFLVSVAIMYVMYYRSKLYWNYIEETMKRR